MSRRIARLGLSLDCPECKWPATVRKLEGAKCRRCNASLEGLEVPEAKPIDLMEPRIANYDESRIPPRKCCGRPLRA